MICSADAEHIQLKTPSVHHVVYVLVTNRFATLYELAHKYTVWEVITLYEIAMVSLYNKQTVIDNKQ